ncbi:unnamed protein product [Rhizophagus irregularis]|nr:unnamed protein product [Rhizophagus irregularis]
MRKCPNYKTALFISNVAWELVDFLQLSMVYAKDFGNLNTNKILNRVSDLHDDVSQTILKINYDLKESELVFMKKSRKNHHQKKEENIRKKKKHREGEREEG